MPYMVGSTKGYRDPGALIGGPEGWGALCGGQHKGISGPWGTNRWAKIDSGHRWVAEVVLYQMHY